MEDFTLRGAWAKAAWSVGDRFWQHVLVLVGIGIVGPMALHYAATGVLGSAFLPSPDQVDTEVRSAGLVLGLLFIGTLYALQLGSYFASWRLGANRRPPLWAAIGWGMIAGAVLTAGAIAVGFGIGYLAGSAPPALAFLLVLFLMLGAVALLYPVLAAFLCVMIMVLVLLGMVFVGTEIGMIVLMVLGGAGSNGVIAFAFAALALWIAARSCCTGPIMAERRSLNFFSALAASWRETWFEQFRILGFLALIGLVLTIVALVLAFAIGAAAWQAQGAFEGLGDAGYVAATLLLGTPFAFLSVAIPAGVYRELTRAPAADVFA